MDEYIQLPDASIAIAAAALVAMRHGYMPREDAELSAGIEFESTSTCNSPPPLPFGGFRTPTASGRKYGITQRRWERPNECSRIWNDTYPELGGATGGAVTWLTDTGAFGDG